eukprot:gene19265-21907_t
MSTLNKSETKSSSSLLKSLVESAIVAFPDDAHQQVLQYLLDAGIDESQALKFRQAWSKVVLGTQAFGRSAKSQVNPSLFSDELLRELSYMDDTVLKVVNACETASKLSRKENLGDTSQNRAPSGEDVKNPREAVASLDAVTNLGNDLANLLAKLYVSSGASHGGDDAVPQIELLESIGLFRKSLRGTRLVWTSTRTLTAGEYVPLDVTIHGHPDLKKGRIDMQLRSDRGDLNAYMSTDELFGVAVASKQALFGVAVASKQAVHQERGWNAYQCLTELLASRGLNIFPLPIGVQRDPASLAAIFAFEATPGAVLLCGLQGPTLSTYLRRVPVVVHYWCAQLAAAHRNLLTCSGSLMKPLRTKKDVFLRDNGLLLLGNVAFDATPPSGKPQQSTSFLQMACDVLQSSLCLSRREAVQMQDDIGSASNHDADDEEETESARPESAGETDTVFSVVVGSQLDLLICGHRCSAVSIESNDTASAATAKKNATLDTNTYRNTNRLAAAALNQSFESANASSNNKSVPSLSTLTVNIAVTSGNYTEYATGGQTKQSTSAPSSSCLRISALKAGVLSLHISALVQDDPSHNGSSSGGAGAGAPRIRRKGCRVKVVIIPAYAVLSVQLQDLIGHLEECHTRSDPRILLHSQLFQRHYPAGGQPLPSSSASDAPIPVTVHTQDVQKGWQDIARVIRNYGNMHNPVK